MPWQTVNILSGLEISKKKIIITGFWNVLTNSPRFYKKKQPLLWLNLNRVKPQNKAKSKTICVVSFCLWNGPLLACGWKSVIAEIGVLEEVKLGWLC